MKCPESLTGYQLGHKPGKLVRRGTCTRDNRLQWNLILVYLRQTIQCWYFTSCWPDYIVQLSWQVPCQLGRGVRVHHPCKHQVVVTLLDDDGGTTPVSR